VAADLEKLGRTSLTVRFTIRVGERLCCTMRTTYVCRTGGESAPWPDDLRARLAD
jgi:acyl-CoA thioester hydrolase